MLYVIVLKIVNYIPIPVRNWIVLLIKLRYVRCKKTILRLRPAIVYLFASKALAGTSLPEAEIFLDKKTEKLATLRLIY